MKVTLILSFLVALATAAIKPADVNFRNEYLPIVGDAQPIHHHPDPKIIGGHEAEPHSIPYQVFVECRNQSYTWSCGGSLISQNYIMTAGHCGYNANQMTITLGAHRILDYEPTQVIVTTRDIKVHEKYQEDRLINDISVAKLPEPVTLSDAIQPISLPSRSDYDNTFEGVIARVSGWGLTDGDDEKLSEVLNYVDLSIISNRLCEKTFGIIMPSVICTSGQENTGSCNGDSGGALVYDGKQIGIVSFGRLACLPGYPDGLTRVTRFLDWLEANTDVKIQ